MSERKQMLHLATEIVKQKLCADHAKIYDMHDKEDLDLLYYYIKDETRKKKQQMADLMAQSTYIAIVKQNRDVGYEFSNKFCAYEIRILEQTKAIQDRDIQIIVPAIVLTL